jgi:hypothetical protein
VNLLGDNIDITKKNTETVTDAGREVGLEKNMNACQNWDIKTANRSFENVAQFRYFGKFDSGRKLRGE